MMGEGFLRQTPAPWLDELPRYLKAIRLRIDKFGGQIGKGRVSVFAQQLGTRMPVSDKRVREQWQLC
jgi:ATP-dependent helicase HrpA